MQIEIGYVRDGVSIKASVSIVPQGEALAFANRLAPEERESVFCEAWSRMHPKVTAELNARLAQLAGEILEDFSVSCAELSLVRERVDTTSLE